MRILIAIAMLAALGTSTTAARASGLDNKPPNPAAIAALQARVLQAPLREQCFLYAQLAHQMTELSLVRYAAGDVLQASTLLKQIQETAQKVHSSLAQNDKRLKDTEILLRHTAFRLNEMLHSSSLGDRALVEQTLAQVNLTQTEIMLQVFRNN
jgi:hypothetical protein